MLAVHVTPKARKNEIAGIHAGADGREALAVRVTAAPSDGAANKAVLETIAKALKLRKSSVRLHSGASARQKRFEIDGDPELLIERLTTIIGEIENDR